MSDTSKESSPLATSEADGRWHVHPVVFPVSAVLIGSFALLGIIFTERVGQITGAVQDWIVFYFGWFYIVSVTLFLIYIVWLALTKYGHVKLGANDEKPEFSWLTWFSMLFSAGMGIGLLYYSAAEPILHFSNPPVGDGGTTGAAIQAMNLTFFHWGLHPWAIYALVGLALAYFSFRRNRPLTIRAAFHPIFGDRVEGWVGNLIDVTAVVSTLFGVATSLGLGAMQVNAGLGKVFGLPENGYVQIALIAGITGIATLSVISGLNVGIRRLSEMNMIIGVGLCLFLLLAGPTLFIFRSWVQSVGYYVQNLPATSLWTATFQGTEWQAGWTVFYWGWWIAWSPFVGMFIARISRGRTLREFVLGVLLVPTLLTFAWIGIFGGAALNLELANPGSMSGPVDDNVAVALFTLFDQYPLGAIASIAAIVVIISFFVTSSDSGSLVIDIITAGGHLDPPVLQRIFWALLEGAVAAVLLVGGGLAALQTAAIATGLPFCVVVLMMAYSLLKGLQEETVIHEVPEFIAPEQEAGVEQAKYT